MTFSILLTYIVLGVGAGILAGLFGVGGGLIIVPVLMFSFQALGMSDNIAAHLAIGTSLATIVFTSISSTQAHHKKGNVDWPLVYKLSIGIKGNVDWPLVYKLSIGIVVGCVLGGFTASLLQGSTLKIIIGCFVLCMAIQLGFNLKPKASKGLPSESGQVAVGGIIGCASAIFGIGGGSLTVPFLSFCSVPMQRAVAVSAACGFPIAVSGALSYIWFGWGVEGLPNSSLGYVYIPALTGIAITSMIFSKLGAKLAYRLSATLLRRLFAAFLFVVGFSFFTPFS